MAEGLIRHALGGRHEIDVVSAGVAAAVGHGAAPETLAILSEAGIDLAGHRARQVNHDLLDRADLVLTMTRSHRDMLVELYPHTADKVFLLGEFSESDAGLDIPDPISGGRQAYLETRDASVSAIPDLLRFIEAAENFDETNPS